MDNKSTTNQFGSSLGDTGFLSDGLTIENTDTTETVAFEEGSDPKKESLEKGQLLSFIQERFQRAKDKRRNDEERWLMCYRNYRGVYGPEVRFTDTEKSQAFMKITKTKVLAAYAQIIDILFSGSKFPIGVESTPIPEGIEKEVHIDPNDPDAGAPQAGMPSTITRKSILDNLGPHKTQLQEFQDKLKSGAGTTPTSLTWEPAKDAAKLMTNKLQDQLAESGADKHLRSFVFEMCLFGQGAMKGPLARDKEYPKWNEDGQYNPVIKQVADIEFVSIWDCYPDHNAVNMDDAEYFIERHRMSKSQIRALKKRPFFRHESIELAIKEGFNYQEQYWENELKDYENVNTVDRYEVLEYWGSADSDFEEITGLKIPKQFKDKDQVQINAWICNGQLLRLVFNPFTPVRIPYQSCPYELNPYSFFGIGVAENMEDTQLVMNGFMRMMIDNAAISSNVIFEINESMLAPNQDYKMYPGKVIRTNTQPGQTALKSIKIDNTIQETLQIFDKARQIADEATGMPSYSHGQSGITGVGRTASGMSMLMGAAKENIKAVVKNIDDYLLVPLGRSLFAFNMQFDFDKEFIGDLDVVALGTSSLMRDEVRSQKIMQYLQATANPIDSPFVKRDYLLRELAQCLDLDPDKAINDPRGAQLQAMKQKELMLAQGIDPNQAGGGPGGPNSQGVPSMGDPSGAGGQVQPGAAPVPQEQGFSGTPRSPTGNGQ